MLGLSGQVIELVLYSGPHCPLCEQAVRLVRASLPADRYRLMEVDISGDRVTKKAYGLRIPVLREVCSGRELGWPFDAAVLRRWWAARL